VIELDMKLSCENEGELTDRECRWGSTLLPRPITRNTSPGLNLTELRRVRKHLGVQRCGQMDRQGLVMGWSKRLWEHRALAMNSQQVLSSLKFCYLLRGHHAMVSAISPAASGQPGLGVSSPRKRRPDELKAEEQQQRDGKETTHAFSINQTAK
jgi:hypothetical protein